MYDLTAMGQAVGALLKEDKQTIAVAESSAGGLISAALPAVPGASAYFVGGRVKSIPLRPDESCSGYRMIPLPAYGRAAHSAHCIWHGR